MRDLMSPDEVKQAAERLLDEVKIHVAEYGCDPKKPSFNLDILVVANAAHTAAAELAAARVEMERLRAALWDIWETVDSLYSEDRGPGIGNLPAGLQPWVEPISIIARVAHEVVRPDLSTAIAAAHQATEDRDDERLLANRQESV